MDDHREERNRRGSESIQNTPSLKKPSGSRKIEKIVGDNLENGSYPVNITRIGENLYKIDGTNTIVQTRSYPKFTNDEMIKSTNAILIVEIITSRSNLPTIFDDSLTILDITE